MGMNFIPPVYSVRRNTVPISCPVIHQHHPARVLSGPSHADGGAEKTSRPKDGQPVPEGASEAIPSGAAGHRVRDEI